MRKAKSRIATTIGLMTVVAIVILMFYYYLSTRTNSVDTSSEEQTEIERILSRDLTKDYPETPREVVKYFGGIIKNLYSNNDYSDEEINALALKARGLYDQEFLDKNPEDVYLDNLYTDIATWKSESRRITNYILVNKDQEEQTEIDGVQYATVQISYTIQKNSKFTEVWKVLLRQDDNKQWKILGWEYVPKS